MKTNRFSRHRHIALLRRRIEHRLLFCRRWIKFLGHLVGRAFHECCTDRCSGFAFVERFSVDQQHHVDKVLGPGVYTLTSWQRIRMELFRNLLLRRNDRERRRRYAPEAKPIAGERVWKISSSLGLAAPLGRQNRDLNQCPRPCPLHPPHLDYNVDFASLGFPTLQFAERICGAQ